MPGDDSDSVLSSIHYFLGLLYADTNEPTLSRKHKEIFLRMQSSICESVSPGFVDTRLGIAFTEMAIAYTQHGQLDEAVNTYRREIDIRKKLGIMFLTSRDASYAWTLMLRGELELAEKVLLDDINLWESTGKVISLR